MYIYQMSSTSLNYDNANSPVVCSDVVYGEARNCVCVWSTSNGRILRKISESALGAVITQSVVTLAGNLLVTSESSCLCIWNLHKYRLNMLLNLDGNLENVARVQENMSFI